MRTPPPLPTAKRNRGLLPFGLAVVANAIVAGFTSRFYFVAAGSHIRPMGWAGFCGMVALGTLGLIIPTALTSIRQDRRYLFPTLAIALAFLPFPLASWMLHHAAEVRGFFLSP